MKRIYSPARPPSGHVAVTIAKNSKKKFNHAADKNTKKTHVRFLSLSTLPAERAAWTTYKAPADAAASTRSHAGEPASAADPSAPARRNP